MPKEEVATICFFKDFSTSVEKVSHDIKILATNGNVKANRCLLRMASPVVHRNLKHNEKADVLDLMDYSVETVKSLLKLIYVGKLSCQSNALKEEVLYVAKELEIEISVFLPDKLIKDPLVKNEKPGMPDKPTKDPLVKNEKPGIMDGGNGRFNCGLCSKTFASKHNGLKHYQEIHRANNEKTIECLAFGCTKKFAVQRYMKDHMRNMHDKDDKIKVPNLSPVPIQDNSKDRERHLMLEQYIGLNNDTGLEQCRFCSKSYKGAHRSSRLRQLFDHVERLHLKLRSYVCDYCSQTFNSKGQKASHISIKHSTEHNRRSAQLTSEENTQNNEISKF